MDEKIKRELREIKRQLVIIDQKLETIKWQNSKTPLLSLTQAAKRLGCSVKKLSQLANSGEIGFTYVGKRKMMSEKNIQDFINGKT